MSATQARATARQIVVWLSDAALLIAWGVRHALIARAINCVRAELAQVEQIERNLPKVRARHLAKQQEGIDQQREAARAIAILRRRIQLKRTAA